jgi:hypothetical protein
MRQVQQHRAKVQVALNGTRVVRSAMQPKQRLREHSETNIWASIGYRPLLPIARDAWRIDLGQLAFSL